MYPPAQGLVLAGGECLGHPWIGQLIITAIMCSTICWMLQGWLPPGWALLGAMLVVLRLGILSYWMDSYWGGSVPALGGALVLGALPRLMRRPRVWHAFLMAAGLAILANSRPYEGLLFSVPVAVAMVVWLRPSHGPKLSVTISHVLLPLVVTLALAAAWTGHYYQRVTGSPLRMAYETNRDTYAMAPYFIFGRSRPEPTYHHTVMRQFYEEELQDFLNNHRPWNFLRSAGLKIVTAWAFYLGPALTVPLVAFPWLLHDRRKAACLCLFPECISGQGGALETSGAAVHLRRRRPVFDPGAMHAPSGAMALEKSGGWNRIGAGHPDGAVCDARFAAGGSSGSCANRAPAPRRQLRSCTNSSQP